MSRRIEIELTSAQDDGTWTWRAAGAKNPKGVLDGSVLPSDATVGKVLKVEVVQGIDGITVQSVVGGRQRSASSEVLELIGGADFDPIVETRAKRDRREGGRGGGRDRGRTSNRRRRDENDGGDGSSRRPRRDNQRRGPRFTPPPELPQRPKPKRLKAQRTHRNEVLVGLPEEQRPIAELALQGMAAVRTRLKAENEKASSEGRATMPEASVLQLAEKLLPQLRVAEWYDRAEAAKMLAGDIDLRDLRSVVAASDDPMVARDKGTRALADELRELLRTRQEEELQLWFGDVDAALAIGRVIRALRLSSQPPKAGVPFPAEISQRLVDSTNATLTPVETAERWIAVLEAAAFSPIHLLIAPMGLPEKITDDLTATVTRLAPAIPQVAALFGIEVEEGVAMPRPLRNNPARERREKKAAAKSQRPKSDKASAAPESTAEAEEANSEADSQVDASMTTQIDQPEAAVEKKAAVEAELSTETETELQAEETFAQDDSAAHPQSAPENAATDADDQASSESEATSSESSDDNV